MIPRPLRVPVALLAVFTVVYWALLASQIGGWFRFGTAVLLLVAAIAIMARLAE